MRVIKFYAHHIDGFEPQERQRDILECPREHFEALELGYTYSVIDSRGLVVAFGGLAPIWDGRQTAWCVLSVHARRHLRELTRIAARELDKVSGDRIEAATDTDFEQGARWLHMLGFDMEAREAAGLVRGKRCSLFVRA